MSQNPNDAFDPNDPLGAWRTIRDANLDAWAKGMAALTGTDTFAKAVGMQLDTLLASAAPVKQAVNEYMESYLSQVNMPSRTEVVSLASRMTNIEMRLDDMQAQLDEILSAIQSVASRPTPALPADAGAPEPAAAPQPDAAPRARTRKPAADER